MNDIATSNKVGPRVCEVLGLDCRRVRKLTILFEAGEVARVNVEMWASVGGIDGISTVLAEYKLVPVDEVVDVTSIGDKARRHELSASNHG